jgi:glutamyl/glutaminyl-tRNA synthetase
MSPASSSSPVLRYAPSPTGYLHVGNAFAAALTFARARRQEGRCVLRIEDLDVPRCPPWASAAIRDDLAAFGLVFDPCTATAADVIAARDDDGVLVQSRRTTAYARALQDLIADDVVYACRCSRRDLQRVASAPHVGDDGPPYPGTCRDLGLPLDAPEVALRVRMDRLVARFGAPVVIDLLCGPFVQDVVTEVGDIVVRRKDGLFSYQLAVVVDDAAQGVTEVTRGRDLLSSAPRQAILHRALGHAPPAFAHLPLLVDEDGHRLSKRSPQAPGLLRHVLAAIGADRLRGHFLHLLGLAGPDAEVSVADFCAAITDDALRVETLGWRPPR